MSRVADATARRSQILRGAADVFATRGYRAATMSDIARAAGLAHGTLYLYFQSKADVFQNLASAFVDQLIAQVNGASTSRFADDLWHMFHRALELCARNPRGAAACMRESIAGGPELTAGLQEINRALLGQVAARVRRAIDAGEIRPVCPESAAFTIVHLVGGATYSLLVLGSESPLAAEVDRLTREMVDFILFGLSGAGAPCPGPAPAETGDN